MHLYVGKNTVFEHLFKVLILCLSDVLGCILKLPELSCWKGDYRDGSLVNQIEMSLELNW